MALQLLTRSRRASALRRGWVPSLPFHAASTEVASAPHRHHDETRGSCACDSSEERPGGVENSFPQARLLGAVGPGTEP